MDAMHFCGIQSSKEHIVIFPPSLKYVKEKKTHNGVKF